MLIPRIIILTTCLLFLSQCLFAGHRDYSKRGGEFEILEGIRLEANKLSFLEKRNVDVEGMSLEASVFQLDTRVTIQTEESPVDVGSVWEKLEVRYELVVGVDLKNAVHDKLIDDIYQFWLANPRDNSVISDKNVSLNNEAYLIFSGRYVPKLVWFNGKFVTVKFLEFRNPRKSGLGAEQSFWEEKIRFYHNNRRSRLEFLVNGLQDEFLRWYEAGKFRRKEE